MTDSLPVAAAIRVMVLADVRLYREGLTALLGTDENVILVGAVPADRDALHHVAATRPEIVLIEALAACETTIVPDLLRHVPEVKVVAYGVLDDEHQAVRCAEIGVAAFVMGDATGEELVGTIVNLARGEFRCPPRVAALLVRRVSTLAQGISEISPQPRLTPRERSILALIDDGFSNKEIARRLGIELSTVKNHVHHILEKLHALRRAQAAARFRQSQALDRMPDPARSRS